MQAPNHSQNGPHDKALGEHAENGQNGLGRSPGLNYHDEIDTCLGGSEFLMATLMIDSGPCEILSTPTSATNIPAMTGKTPILYT